MYQRILVPIDGSKTATHGLDEAVRLAGLTNGSLLLVHVVDELKYVTGFESFVAYTSDLVPYMQEAGEQILQLGADRARRAGVPAETLLFTSLAERVADAIIRQAVVWKADLIVIGTHGRHGVGRVLLGSDAEQILRASPVPVLLVRSGHTEAGAEAASGEGVTSHASLAA